MNSITVPFRIVNRNTRDLTPILHHHNMSDDPFVSMATAWWRKFIKPGRARLLAYNTAKHFKKKICSATTNGNEYLVAFSAFCISDEQAKE